MSLVGFTVLCAGPLLNVPVPRVLGTTGNRDFACLRCGARVGEACRSTDGRRSTRAHRERIKAGSP